MLITQLIERLERVKREHGDLSVYFKDEWTIHPLVSASLEIIDEEQADCSDLEVGQPIAVVL